MGGNCSNGSPNLRNRCSTHSLSDSSANDYTIENFCVSNNDRSVHRKACQQMSARDEWRTGSTAGSCCYDLQNEGERWTCGCCDGNCASAIQPTGQRNCDRIKYTADPLPCCQADLDFTLLPDENNDNYIYNDKCFTNGGQSTCAPNNRDITSDTTEVVDIQTGQQNISCRTATLRFCSGADLAPGNTAWINRWLTNDMCTYVIRRNLFTQLGENGWVRSPGFFRNITQPGAIYEPNDFINAAGFAFATELMSAVFARYAADGFNLGVLPGTTGYSPLQNILYAIAQNIPGIVGPALNRFCSNQSINRLLLAPQLVPWCGCYMPNSEYAQYQNDFSINRECTPICNRLGNIFSSTPSGTDKLNCRQQICLIDDVTITLAQTNVGGSVNFNQFCGGCNSGTCQCYVVNNNVIGVNSTIGGGININESCSGISCYRTGDDSRTTTENNQGLFQPAPENTAEVSCDAPVDFNPLEERLAEQTALAQEQARNNTIRIILAVLVLLAIIFVILLLSTWGAHSDKIIPRHTASNKANINNFSDIAANNLSQRANNGLSADSTLFNSNEMFTPDGRSRLHSTSFDNDQSAVGAQSLSSRTTGTNNSSDYGQNMVASNSLNNNI